MRSSTDDNELARIYIPDVELLIQTKKGASRGNLGLVRKERCQDMPSEHLSKALRSIYVWDALRHLLITVEGRDWYAYNCRSLLAFNDNLQ